jgi:hypothetical protein
MSFSSLKIPATCMKLFIDKNHKNITKSKMNKLVKIYNEVKKKGDIVKTSLICSNLFIQTNYDFCVFISISIPIMTQYDPYENESLVMTLNVEKNSKLRSGWK